VWGGRFFRKERKGRERQNENKEKTKKKKKKKKKPGGIRRCVGSTAFKQKGGKGEKGFFPEKIVEAGGGWGEPKRIRTGKRKTGIGLV